MLELLQEYYTQKQRNPNHKAKPKKKVADAEGDEVVNYDEKSRSRNNLIDLYLREFVNT